MPNPEDGAVWNVISYPDDEVLHTTSTYERAAQWRIENNTRTYIYPSWPAEPLDEFGDWRGRRCGFGDGSRWLIQSGINGNGWLLHEPIAEGSAGAILLPTFQAAVEAFKAFSAADAEGSRDSVGWCLRAEAAGKGDT